MERDFVFVNGNQDVNKNMDDSYRQFYLFVINSDERIDLILVVLFYNCINDFFFSGNNFILINDLYNKVVGDNFFRNFSLVNGSILFLFV